MRRVVIVGVVAATLAACAGSSQPSLGPPQVAEKAEGAGGDREVTLPAARVGEPANGLAVALSARVDRKSGQVRPFLRAEITYVAARPRTYDTARDAGGVQLKSERVGGNERCSPAKSCTYDEIWLISLPEPALRQAKSTGYRVKLFARSGPEVEIGIPAAQIASLFEKADGSGTPAATARAPAAPAR